MSEENKTNSEVPVPRPGGGVEFKPGKKGLWAVLAVCIIAGAGVVWQVSRNSGKQPENHNQTSFKNQQQDTGTSTLDYIPDPEIKVELTKTEAPANTLPEGLPKDMPVEEGAKIISNYSGTDSLGRKQAGRIFESAGTVNENSMIYGSYLESSGWKVIILSNLDNYKVYDSSKDSQRLGVIIRKDSGASTVTVELSWIDLTQKK